MRIGIDRLLLKSSPFAARLKGRRLGLVAHPASVTSTLKHSFDALIEARDFKVSSSFGPQHGMRGDKQDNMIESEDYKDPSSGVPVFSLYGTVRRPTKEMLDTFDVLLFDLQDIGCRIYTYLTTLFYLLEDCAQAGKAVWILDRPNPAGRPLEGNLLKKEMESFVGAVPVPMRHGLTLGEMALWIVKRYNLRLELEVIAMEGYDPNVGPGFGWPEHELSWINPSPNVPVLGTTRAFAGTVLLEGTNLSEGRGTTRPLEVVGAPGMKVREAVKELERLAPRYLEGCRLRECFFEPTFHKFSGRLCAGLQIHVDGPGYDHERFRPYRFMLGFFKALRKVQPNLLEWRKPPYEYESVRLPVDLLSGDTAIREWVDDSSATVADLEALLVPAEKAWKEERRDYLLYADNP